MATATAAKRAAGAVRAGMSALLVVGGPRLVAAVAPAFGVGLLAGLRHARVVPPPLAVAAVAAAVEPGADVVGGHRLLLRVVLRWCPARPCFPQGRALPLVTVGGGRGSPAPPGAAPGRRRPRRPRR